jgi:hypothetical protein
MSLLVRVCRAAQAAEAPDTAPEVRKAAKQNERYVLRAIDRAQETKVNFAKVEATAATMRSILAGRGENSLALDALQIVAQQLNFNATAVRAGREDRLKEAAMFEYFNHKRANAAVRVAMAACEV